MSTQADLYDTTGPNIALSREDRELLEDLVRIFDEDLPTLDHDDLVERFEEQHGGFIYTGNDHNPSAETPDLGDFKEQFLPAPLGLPSHGEYGQEDCGVGIPHVCEDCGFSVEIGRTCSQSRCPRCWAAWVMKTAPGLVARIMSAAKMKDGAQYKHHVVVSPPPETYIDAEHPEQAALDAVGDFMDRIDLDGIALYHPWSGAQEDHDDQGEWKFRIGEDADWYGEVREDLEHRPHFHVIGACPHVPGGGVTKALESRTGWIIDRITEKNGSPISLADERSVARALCYSLSHTAIDTRDLEDSFGGEDGAGYVRKKKGSAFHKPVDDVEEAHPSHAENLKEAKDAVHNVAPDVLGIPSMEIECQEQVEKEEDAAKDHDVSELIDEDGDGAGDDAGEDGGDSTKVLKCRGDMVDVDDADFVDDPDWRRQADYAEQAVDAREKWENAGGWQGWSGQATLDAERADVEGDPPPE
ncbi:hypothetical protein [Halobacterium litoreum]|uniref:Uncharacterized protein n=1 Tax=Halobacterium litoreum TaxID=2039234 RepID=A0ABD5NA43_9EURY|nr:hypothetical protein [Halobacterium litoreum]UHH14882.1 hypothetical protein LT972_14715 [Halobacterium litoreum]